MRDIGRSPRTRAAAFGQNAYHGHYTRFAFRFEPRRTTQRLSRTFTSEGQYHEHNAPRRFQHLDIYHQQAEALHALLSSPPFHHYRRADEVRAKPADNAK